MPIVVTCPECSTKLSAPDSAVGKQVRCPKCGAAAPVAAASAAPALAPTPAPTPAPEPTPAPPRAKPKPAPAESDDDERPRKKSRRDEDDADDDPPRKKKRRDDDDDYDHDNSRRRGRGRSGGSGGGGKVAIIAAVAVLLLIGVGVGIYFLVGKGSSSAKKAPVPPGWVQHSYPEEGFRAYFPKTPTYMNVPTFGGFGGLNPGGFGQGGFGGKGFPNVGGFEDVLPGAERFAVISSGTGFDSVYIQCSVIRFRNEVPASLRGSFRQSSGKFGGVEMRNVKWLGHDAIEQVHGNIVMRMVYTERHFITATIGGPNGGRAKPEEEAAFFDNFELIK